MRKFLAALLFTCVMPSWADSLPLHAPLNSLELGFGDGIKIIETARTNESSDLKVWRTYEYKGHPGTAWGTPQNFFLSCALRLMGVERQFTQVKVTYLVLEDGNLRNFRSGENMMDVGPEQFYVRVTWLTGNNDDVQSLLAQKIVPFNAQLAETCQKFQRPPTERK